MKLRESFDELLYPARSAACLLALLSFTLLFAIAAALLPAIAGIGSIFALLLLAIVVPAFARFLVSAAESRAAGRAVEPPGIELFMIADGGGMLFPLLGTVALLFSALPFVAGPAPTGAVALASIGILVLPAMIAVYVITHSSLQALNPVKVAGLVRILGAAYFAAPVFIVLSIGAVRLLYGVSWWLALFAAVCLLLASHCLLGGLLRVAGLPGAIDLPEDDTIGADMAAVTLARERRVCLNHAYGLFSRDNGSGALHYLRQWLSHRDPDPAVAYAWFLEQMLGWEDKWPALRFGQDYLGWLLAGGERVRAVKLILRLRLVDERFRPADGDVPAAAEALRGSGHADLADLFERAVL